MNHNVNGYRLVKCICRKLDRIQRNVSIGITGVLKTTLDDAPLLSDPLHQLAHTLKWYEAERQKSLRRKYSKEIGLLHSFMANAKKI